MNIPLEMMVVALAEWVNEQQLAVIEYLKEENRVVFQNSYHPRLVALQRPAHYGEAVFI